MNLELSPDIIIPAHDMSGIQLELSFHQKWIASAASDGRMVLRLAETPVSQMCVAVITQYFAVIVRGGQLV